MPLRRIRKWQQDFFGVFAKKIWNYLNFISLYYHQLKFSSCKRWIQKRIFWNAFSLQSHTLSAHSRNGQKIFYGTTCYLTLRRPLRRKLRMRWFFDISKVKDLSFVNRTSLTPHQIFDAHVLENTDLSPFRYHFSVGFISRSCFKSDGFIAYSNELDWRENERCLFTLTNL